MPGASPEIDQELDPFDHPQSTMLGKAKPRNEQIQYKSNVLGGMAISGGRDYSRRSAARFCDVRGVSERAQWTECRRSCCFVGVLQLKA